MSEISEEKRGNEQEEWEGLEASSNGEAGCVLRWIPSFLLPRVLGPGLINMI